MGLRRLVVSALPCIDTEFDALAHVAAIASCYVESNTGILFTLASSPFFSLAMYPILLVGIYHFGDQRKLLLNSGHAAS